MELAIPKLIDLIDIAVVALLLLQIYRMIRGTAALTIFIGVFILYAIYTLVKMLEMKLLSEILGQIMSVGALALVIVFQQEIRRYLLLLGSRISNTRNKFWRRIFSSRKTTLETSIATELDAATASMSTHKTGALIVIERTTDLSPYAATGDAIEGQLSARLVEAIFFKNSPMHDGAMIVRGSQIVAARCILPTSDNPEIPAHMGLRHRAAIGISEHSDALVIVVSEETGRVTIVEAGEYTTLAKEAVLSEILAQKMSH